VGGVSAVGRCRGTAGYGGAVGQVLFAVFNAAYRVLEKEPVLFSRAESYIGVMIDDLTTRGVTEPYRMFTSRAEFRLSLRADNADQRLTDMGIELGCVLHARQASFGAKREALATGRTQLNRETYTPKQIQSAGITINQDGTRRNGFALLAFPNVDFEDLLPLDPELSSVPDAIRRQLERDALYANYIERQKKDVETLKKDEALSIPGDFAYWELDSLSNELKSKLERTRPSNMLQAAKIDGMTPAALALILARIKRDSRKESA